jgi:hypothetical protein
MGDHMEMGRPQGDFFGVLWNGPRYLSLESISNGQAYLFICSPPSSEASGAFGEASPGAQLQQAHPCQQHDVYSKIFFHFFSDFAHFQDFF